MKNRNNILVLLAAVLIFNTFFQLFRSDFILKLYKNNSETSSNSYILYKLPKNVKKEKFLIIVDNNESNSIEIKNNIVQTLKYMKKSSVVENVNNIKNIDNSYEGVIVTFENLDHMSDLNLLINYTENGGNVFFAERPEETDSLNKISNLLGIKSYGNMSDAKGIKLLSNVLIKGTGLGINGDIEDNSSLGVSLNKQSSVLAVSSDKKTLLLWKSTFGMGNVVVFNGTCFNEKNQRGMITGAISLLVPNFIYPVMPVKLSFIDDFPSPVPSGDNKSIYKDYGLTTAEFYREVWWPDILKGSKIYNLKYTGTIIEDYTNNTKPPFKSQINNNNNLILYGSELIRSGGEMGIHGYNHQSLAPNGYIKENLGYKPWSSINDMEMAINEVEKYAKSGFPNYNFRVYVPPSNILSPEGKEALKKSMPDLKVISSVYVNNSFKDAYAQEFEIKNGIAELPRITSGYFDNNETLWDDYNSITSLGVFSHFIHPDDVLDPARNQGKSWEKLLKSYNSLMNNINVNFPWISPMTASEGAQALKDYLNINPVVEYKNNLINVYCNNFRENSQFILRSSSKILSNSNCSVREIDSGVYLVTAKKADFSLKVVSR